MNEKSLTEQVVKGGLKGDDSAVEEQTHEFERILLPLETCNHLTTLYMYESIAVCRLPPTGSSPRLCYLCHYCFRCAYNDHQYRLMYGSMR